MNRPLLAFTWLIRLLYLSRIAHLTRLKHLISLTRLTHFPHILRFTRITCLIVSLSFVSLYPSPLSHCLISLPVSPSRSSHSYQSSRSLQNKGNLPNRSNMMLHRHNFQNPNFSSYASYLPARRKRKEM